MENLKKTMKDQGRRIKSFTRQYLWCITITY